MADTWMWRDLPVLETLARLESYGQAPIDYEDLLGEVPEDIEEDLVELAIRALGDAKYLEWKDSSTFGGFGACDIRLREKGRRATGQWPSEDPFDALVQLLEARLADGSTDEVTRSKLRGLLDTLLDVGKGTATAVLTAYVRGVAGV